LSDSNISIKGEGNVYVHSISYMGGNSGISSRILCTISRWKSMVSFTSWSPSLGKEYPAAVE